MMHYLNDTIFQLMTNLKTADGDLSLAWSIILADDTLTPLLRRDKIDVYYRGFKAFSISESGITKNPIPFENSLFTYEIPDNIPKDDFASQLPYIKQSIDLWFGDGNSSYEREFTQMILRENNSKKAGNLSDYFIIDMEHQYEPGGAIPDLIGLIMGRGKRQKPVFRLSVMEVKYLDAAFSGKAGILAHMDEYIRLINDERKLDELKKDVAEMCYQSKKLGLLPGIKNAYERIDISNERPELLFLLIARNTHNGSNNRQDEVESLKVILKNAQKEYGDLLADTYIAQTAEIGFGLYADRKTSVQEFCDQL